MIQEFETGQAVVLDAGGKILWQLVKYSYDPETGYHHVFCPQHALLFHTQKKAKEIAKKMGVCQKNIIKIKRRFEFVYGIQYDPRFDYIHATWEVQ